MYNVISNSNYPIYIYGAGIRGKRLLELFPEHNWGGFVDMNPLSDNYNNVDIINCEQFIERYKFGTTIIVSNMVGVQEIISSLLGRGIAKEDIYVLNDFNKINERNIYFLPECMANVQSRKGAFVDIGCYDGRDSLNYLKWGKDDKAKIYAFELDSANYEACKNNLAPYSNIELFNIGLSDVEEGFGVVGEAEGVRLGEAQSDVMVQTQLLDNILEDKKIKYIKMDVEGFEENVINGARNIISSQHPVLAISIYHKQFDILRLPKLVLSLNKDYKFFLRHYGISCYDTVLYAVDERDTLYK